MHEVSRDLPDHFKSKFSRVSSRQRPGKGKKYEPVLLTGISPEAPDFFKLSNIPVLTVKTREDIYSRLATPKKTSNINTHCRRSSFDSAGLATGRTKHKGEFILPYPRISRHLTIDEETLRNYLERNSKSRVKRYEKDVKLKDEIIFTSVSKTRPKTAKLPEEDKFEFQPKTLTQKESRVLYNF
jgi:hypothetical protein